MRTTILLFILSISIACAACSHVKYTVSDSYFKNISIDKKAQLLESENDLAIAENDLLQISAQIVDFKRTMHDKNNDAEQKLYLRMSMDYLKSRLDIQASIIDVAQAKFELAKVQMIKKYKLAKDDLFDINQFSNQIVLLQKIVDNKFKILKSNIKDIEQARTNAINKRHQLLGSNIEKINILGDDDTPVWEIWP